MDNKDYEEIAKMVKGAETAILSGELTDWQHATTSTFHVLATAILDLHARINRGDDTGSLANTGDLYNGI